MLDRVSPARWWTLRRRVAAAVLALAVLLVGTGAVAVLAESQVEAANQRLAGQWLPALVALERLDTAYLDQQASVRGYALTSQAIFLEPYRSAEVVIDREDRALRTLVGMDPTQMAQLAAVQAAHTAWLESARGNVSMVEVGRADLAQAATAAGTGRQLFTVLQGRLDEMRANLEGAVGAAAAEMGSVRNTMLAFLLGAVGLGVAVTLALLYGLRRSVTGPLLELVGAVSRVADGRLDQPVPVGGPPEFATVAGAVERMRQELNRHASDAVLSAEVESALREAERIARELQDVVIARLFGASLVVSSALNRHPELAEPLGATLTELDGAIRDVRAAVLGLGAAPVQAEPARARVVATAEWAEVELGLHVNRIRVDGQVDGELDRPAADEMVLALRGALGDLAGHDDAATVDIELAAAPGAGGPRLRVTCESAELPGTRWAREVGTDRVVLVWFPPPGSRQDASTGGEAGPPG